MRLQQEVAGTQAGLSEERAEAVDLFLWANPGDPKRCHSRGGYGRGELGLTRRLPAVKKPAALHTILSVEPHPLDQLVLQGILDGSPGSHWWKVKATPTMAAALAVVQRTKIPIVFCECDLRPDLWKRLVEHLTLLPHAPQVIVTSRLADDRLWAEALNLGAYDVLAKPFDRAEVVRTVSLAWLRWTKDAGILLPETRLMKAAS